MKKILCLLLALALCCPALTALGERMTAQGEMHQEPFSAELLMSPDAFALTTTGAKALSLTGKTNENGQMVVANNQGTAVIFPQFTLDETIAVINSTLENSPLVEATRYSSLFTQARTITLGSHQISQMLLPVLAAWPTLDVTGTIAAALNAALSAPDQPWATISRYLADERQYPDAAMWLVNVYAPCLPAMYAELRTDEYGQSFTFAIDPAPVSDWDETIIAIEEGRNATGYLAEGFTLVFDEGDETNTFLEMNLFLGATRYLVEADHYANAVNPAEWNATLSIKDSSETVILSATLANEKTAAAITLPAYDTLIDAAVQSGWVDTLLK